MMPDVQTRPATPTASTTPSPTLPGVVSLGATEREPEPDRTSGYDRVEAALTALVRRTHRVHLHPGDGPVLERAAYGLLGRLYDQGPMRHGALAVCFGLDPSTVSRQVQGLEEAGLVVRRPDPADRRAAVVDLTEAGRAALCHTRAARRQLMRGLLAEWTEAERDEFADYLERVDEGLQAMVDAHAVGAPGGSAVGAGGQH